MRRPRAERGTSEDSRDTERTSWLFEPSSMSGAQGGVARAGLGVASGLRTQKFLHDQGGEAMSFIWFILIGLVAGWLAGQVMKGGGYGVLGDIIIGVIGALLGGWLFGVLGIWPGGGLIGSLI